MSLADDQVGLGAEDYSEKPDGVSQFLSKPTQRAYQPFGGPKKQADPGYVDYSTGEYLSEPQQPQQSFQQYQSPLDELDAYDQFKEQYKYVSSDASAHSSSASLWEDRYKDFVETKLKPFHKGLDLFGDQETDDDFITQIDELYGATDKASKAEDGFWGSSDEKETAIAGLGKFGGWHGPNGLREQFFKLKEQSAGRRAMADKYRSAKVGMMDSMTAVPMQQRMALEEGLKARNKAPMSDKKTNEFLDQFEYEDPYVDYSTGNLVNGEKIDPRKWKPTHIDYSTGESVSAADDQMQKERMEVARRGDSKRLFAKRDLVQNERRIRDKGVMMSTDGLMDGRPLGLSRNDVDLLDLEELKKSGMTSYKGQPIDKVMATLGGEERLNMAKVMQGVYSAKSNWEDAQLEFLKVAGTGKASKAQAKMEAEKEAMHKVIALAAEFGLDNELFEQAESTSWIGGLGNAIKRGSLMHDLSKYSDDFLTNTLDASEIQKIIDISTEMEGLGASKFVEKFHKSKSKGWWEALGNLAFDNPAAIPELFVESMASFLPAYITNAPATVAASAATGAVVGTAVPIPGWGTIGGGIVGGKIGLRINWGVASMVLEYSGTVLEGMKELGIDWKNPKVFAAAWNNEDIRSKVKEKALKKGVPIGLLDAATGMMGGRVNQAMHHGTNAAFRGGKLLDSKAWARAGRSAPRFSKFERIRNISTEIGVDSAFGMGGEALGQLWSREPGEALDYDAIAAEGVVGLGPGLLGGVLEYRKGSKSDFTTAPFDFSDVTSNDQGTQGSVNRAGMRDRFRTFNDPRALSAFITESLDGKPRSDSQQFTDEFFGRMYELAGEGMQNLKVVIADRTPFADKDMEGSFEFDDESGTGVIYINKKAFEKDPVGVFMHESGHFARLHMFQGKDGAKEFHDLYGSLSRDEQVAAYAEYRFKRDYKTLSEEEKATNEKDFRRMDVKIRAEEWFSYQWARYIVGGKVSSQVKAPFKQFKKAFVEPILKTWASGEDTANSAELDAKMQKWLGVDHTGSPVGPATPAPPVAEAPTPEAAPAPEAKPELTPITEEAIQWDDDKYIYFTHGTDAVSLKHIQENGFDVSRSGGGIENSIKRHKDSADAISRMESPSDHKGADHYVVFQIEKSKFDKNLRDGGISYETLDRGSTIIPSEFVAGFKAPSTTTGSGTAQGSQQSEEKSAISKTMDLMEIKARAQTPEEREFQKKIDNEPDRKQAAEMAKVMNTVVPGNKFYTAEENAAAQTRENEKILRTRKVTGESKEKQNAARDSGYATSLDADRNTLGTLLPEAQVTAIRPIVEGELKALEAWIAEEREYEKALEKQNVKDSKEAAKERQGSRAAKKEAAEKKGMPDLRLKEDEVGQKGPGPKSGVGSGDKVTGKNEPFGPKRLKKLKKLRKLKDNILEKSKTHHVPEGVAGGVKPKKKDKTKPKAKSSPGVQKPDVSAMRQEAKAFKQGNRYKVKFKASGQKSAGSPKYFKTEAEAIKAQKAFVDSGLAKLLNAQKTIQGIKKDIETGAIDAKLDAAEKTLGPNASSLAIVAEVWPIKQLMLDSPFSMLAGLSEAAKRRFTSKTISMDDVADEIFKIEQQIDGAIDALERRKAELKKSIRMTADAWIESQKPKVEGEAPKEGPTGWDRVSDNSFEVSTQGNDIGKAFSALNAKLSDGKTIEYHYQVNVKGYSSISEGKGKPPKDTSIDSYAEYKKLWERFAEENPEKMEQLRKASDGKVLTDKFAKTDVSQARALYEILSKGAKPAPKPALSKFDWMKADQKIEEAKKSSPELYQQITAEQKKLELVDNYLGVIAPEKQAIEWAKVPHSFLWIQQKTDQYDENGNVIYTPEERLPLGFMAETKKLGKDYRISKKVKGQLVDAPQDKNLQSVLLKWATPGQGTSWTPQENDLNNPDTKKDYLGNLSPNEYRIKLEAVRAAMLLPSQYDIGSKSMHRMEKGGWAGQEARTEKDSKTEIPAGFTSEQGTRIASFLLNRLREREGKKGRKTLVERQDLFDDAPTLEEFAIYESALGRRLELDGDLYSGLKEYHFYLFAELRAQSMREQVKELTAVRRQEKDPAKVKALTSQIKALHDFERNFYPDPDSIADYAEQTGGLFPKIEGGKAMGAPALSDFGSARDKAEALAKLIRYYESDLFTDAFGREDRNYKTRPRSGGHALDSDMAVDTFGDPSAAVKRIKDKLGDRADEYADSLEQYRYLLDTHAQYMAVQAEQTKKWRKKLYKHDIGEGTIDNTITGDNPMSQSVYSLGLDVPGFTKKGTESIPDYLYSKILESQHDKVEARTKDKHGHKKFERIDVDRGTDVIAVLFGEDMAEKMEATSVGKSEQVMNRLVAARRGGGGTLGPIPDGTEVTINPVTPEESDAATDTKIPETTRRKVSTADEEVMQDVTETLAEPTKKLKSIKASYDAANEVWTNLETGEKLTKADAKNAVEAFREQEDEFILPWLLGSRHVSPASLAAHLMNDMRRNEASGVEGLAKAMEGLQNLPSSKDKKQLHGAPGEGFLPGAFKKLMEMWYKDLGISDTDYTGIEAKYEEDTLNPDKNEKPFAWNMDATDYYSQLTEGRTEGRKGKQKENVLFPESLPGDPDGAAARTPPHPKEMAEMFLPVLQAVIDAERLDIFGDGDVTDNLLQRDTQEGTDGLFEGAEGEGIIEEGEESTSKEDEFQAGKVVTFTEGDPVPTITDTAALEQIQKLKVVQKLTDDGLIKYMVESGLASEKITVESAREVIQGKIDALGSHQSLSSHMPQIGGQFGLLAKLQKMTGDAADHFKGKIEAGTFATNYIDQSRPTKVVFKDIVEKLDLKPDHPLYDALDIGGKWHQYFGKGYVTVEDAHNRFVQPILDALRDSGVSMRQFGEYLLARAAPSRNIHLENWHKESLKNAAKELAEAKANQEKHPTSDRQKEVVEARQKEFDKIEAHKPTSGISTESAVNAVIAMEKESAFKKLLKTDAIRLFYEMNMEQLDMKAKAGLIMDQKADIKKGEGIDTATQDGISERGKMIGAMSHFNWATDPKERGLATENSTANVLKDDEHGPKNSSYAYAPMQGFDGETQEIHDKNEAWELLGRKGSSTGKGWDQQKMTFLQHPAFGRSKDAKGPNPDTTMAVALDQYMDAAARSAKAEVSQSFGNLFEILRSIAFPERDDAVKIPSDLKVTDELRAKVKEEYFGKGGLFEEQFTKSEDKNMWVLEEEEIDGKPGSPTMKRVTKRLNKEFSNDPHVFVYRVDGVPRFIKFRDTVKGTEMAVALKNLSYEALPDVLRKINWVTRGMAMMFTSMNLAFIIPNFFRDLGTAFIHLSEDDKKKLIKHVFKLKNLKWVGAIAKAEWQTKQGKNPFPSKDMELTLENAKRMLDRGNKIEMYQFMKKAGAKIGYFRHKPLPEQIQDLIDQTDPAKQGGKLKSLKKRLKAVGDIVDTMNTGVENSIRASAFWAAIRENYTVQQAATISRNVTVDFNQKGNLTQSFGALYVFFGASVNSMDRFYETFRKRSPKDRAKLVGGILGASFTIAMFNRLLDDDENEDEPDYDGISSFRRDTNLILPMPSAFPGNDSRDTGYFSVPLPLGYNIFWAMGQAVADNFANGVMERGGTGPFESMARISGSMLNAFNPVGGGGLGTMLTPTAVKPFTEIWANQNFMGNKIRYEDMAFQAPKPGHMQDPGGTPEHWTALSKSINSFLGGDDNAKGSARGALGSNPLMYSDEFDVKFDISGNQMRHLVMGYLGGPGLMLDAMGGGIWKAAQGEAGVPDWGQVPIVNRFARGSTYGASTRDAYYSIRNSVKTAEKVVERTSAIGAKVHAAARKDNKALLTLSKNIKAIDGMKSDIRRRKAKVESSKTLSDEQKTQRVDELELKELRSIMELVKKARKLGIAV
jgi:hypothetical protein